jgi:hypothetical protein
VLGQFLPQVPHGGAARVQPVGLVQENQESIHRGHGVRDQVALLAQPGHCQVVQQGTNVAAAPPGRVRPVQ